MAQFHAKFWVSGSQCPREATTGEEIPYFKE